MLIQEVDHERGRFQSSSPFRYGRFPLANHHAGPRSFATRGGEVEQGGRGRLRGMWVLQDFPCFFAPSWLRPGCVGMSSDGKRCNPVHLIRSILWRLRESPAILNLRGSRFDSEAAHHFSRDLPFLGSDQNPSLVARGLRLVASDRGGPRLSRPRLGPFHEDGLGGLPKDSTRLQLWTGTRRPPHAAMNLRRIVINEVHKQANQKRNNLDYVEPNAQDCVMRAGVRVPCTVNACSGRRQVRPARPTVLSQNCPRTPDVERLGASS
jgi:hypothetical protein